MSKRGVVMRVYVVAALFGLFFQCFVASSTAAALDGCLATGINGGCVRCSGSSCSLTGPSSTNQVITFDGGVLRASCSLSGCSGLQGNFSNRQACIGGGAACFRCSSDGCSLSSVSARSLLGGGFQGLNLNSFLNQGNVGQLIDFRGVENVMPRNELLATLNNLSDAQLTNLLNTNDSLRNFIGSGNLGSYFDRLNGLSGLNQNVRVNLGLDDVLGGIGNNGGLGSNNPSRVVSEYTGSSEKSMLAGSVADTMYGDPNEIDPLKQFNYREPGDNALNRSPILFDPKGADAQRVYPELAQSGDHANGDGMRSKSTTQERPSFGALELGTTQEIRKASWGIYKPISTMQKDYAEHQKGVDAFLDRYETALGIAKTTLQFLDPAVAVSLHQVQTQIDASVTNSLLKQATWSLDKIARPENSFVHADVQEKLEACLAGPDRGENLENRMLFDSSCEDPIDQGGCGADLNSNSNTFAACQCCAESSKTLNKTLKDGDNTYSLVDKVFFGNDKGEQARGRFKSKSGVDPLEAIEQVTTVFRNLYGDIVMETDEDGVIKLRHEMPYVSIPQQIKHFRDGTEIPQRTCKKNRTSSMTCPITQQYIEQGICPSIYKMMIAQSKKDQKSVADTSRSAVEASLGIILTGTEYKGMLAKAGLENEELPDDWTPTEENSNKEFNTWLNNFCDASAYVALNKLHTGMKSVLIDHLQLNSTLNPEERNKIMLLIDRFSAQFALAEGGVAKEAQHLHGMVGRLAVASSRETLRGTSSALASMNNSNSMPGPTTVFGGVVATHTDS